MGELWFRKSKIILLLLPVFFLIASGGCSIKSAPQAGIFGLDDGTMLLRGKVVRVKEDYLLVKYSRTKHLRLKTSADMTLRGFASLREIETDQPVKVNYRLKGGKNVIISIAKMANLGC